MFWDFFGRKRIAALEAANERLQKALLREGQLYNQCNLESLEISREVFDLRNKYERAWKILKMARLNRPSLEAMRERQARLVAANRKIAGQVDYIAELETDLQKAQQWIKARDAQIADLTAKTERLGRFRWLLRLRRDGRRHDKGRIAFLEGQLQQKAGILTATQEQLASTEQDREWRGEKIRQQAEAISSLTAEVERLKGELERTSSQQGDALREALAERNAAWVARDAMIKQRDLWEQCASRLRDQLRGAVETVDRVVAAPYVNHRGGES